ncbi:hypothetical protein BDM02DRAFT_2415144 [Thelephora ganbajun]|uniref:Uncharacterized protein n=1 Tax=Thelephora ganbajun TaxID=370292 RepID=A0ACB6ZU37_THEGA|nr:hypothetical protein BDM02DRAFT_2415144 [Thelephora ganbajun]
MFSPPCSPCSVVSPQPSHVDGGPQFEIPTSAVESSLETPNNPSQNSDNSLISCLSTPDRSITTSRRILKARLAPNFPSRVTHTITQRITSLPETAPSFSVKSQVASQQRVVTMPEDIRSQRLEKEFVLYPPEYEDSPIRTSNSFSISDGNSSFARADQTGTDISHSSSSPSSPDSVVIIQNKYRISQAFLRQTSVETKAKTDEDWMTWASSPPRPIPALHGPSSLPYARCPSGAEGTIIEEQDNLPRMIWGLDQDTAKPEIMPPESSHRTSETAPAPGALGNVSSVIVSQNPPTTANTENTKPVAEQKTHHPNFIEPIDLGPMLAPQVQENAYQQPQIDVTGGKNQGLASSLYLVDTKPSRILSHLFQLKLSWAPLSRSSSLSLSLSQFPSPRNADNLLWRLLNNTARIRGSSTRRLNPNGLLIPRTLR